MIFQHKINYGNVHDLSNLFRFTLIFLEVGHGKTKLNRWTERSPKMRNLHRCHSWQKISKYEKQQMHTDWEPSPPSIQRVENDFLFNWGQ